MKFETTKGLVIITSSNGYPELEGLTAYIDEELDDLFLLEEPTEAHDYFCYTCPHDGKQRPIFFASLFNYELIK